MLVPSRGLGEIKLQAGYTGHITQIGHRLLAAAAERAAVEQYLEAHDGWQEFAAGRLTEAMKVSDDQLCRR